MASRQLQQQITVDGQQVLVVRSARRTRTISADQVAGTLRLRVPVRLSQREIEDHARAFQKKLSRRAARRPRSDEELLARASALSARYLDGVPQPEAVSWSTQQHQRWGSTTSTTGTIRLSSRLREMPVWVQDSVLVHELAHLIEPGHGPSFKALVAKYPRTGEADAFLAGVSWADHHAD
ncbi:MULTISPECIES: M48 metallopeptidase family protein [unclassified Nesterenkonia]|uniref:M48 metallopeptidase family protein n=1 Tax=unclassified Nesterenkonia TaxID=2629769 RepID=UPI001F4CA630|nr:MULTISPECIES: M48 family metallopeptidase [unclassified Nesterenkonia]MCH8559862.1 M48 family metallopeptidase [Nesterenkonia sp. DZ6]MCH8562046.1 M48 family metallopeptidase [Nesterenkonia sp. YGD6]MCH8570054.1 M48 family metallopeptidase [Nesterenkonia sp. AY15]